MHPGTRVALRPPVNSLTNNPVGFPQPQRWSETVTTTPRAPESRPERTDGRSIPLGFDDMLRTATRGTLRRSLLLSGLLLAAAPDVVATEIFNPTMPVSCTPVDVQ